MRRLIIRLERCIRAGKNTDASFPVGFEHIGNIADCYVGSGVDSMDDCFHFTYLEPVYYKTNHALAVTGIVAFGVHDCHSGAEGLR